MTTKINPPKRTFKGSIEGKRDEEADQRGEREDSVRDKRQGDIRGIVLNRYAE